ncbi:hypothetical protein IQ07DRAFT_344942 [Pyrenochaeta sp. DS3sAY3a]|nr:hypothetical protein IQ07DRAFT_344942 [Pyrenochaeta sp. DS3sAY3a]
MAGTSRRAGRLAVGSAESWSWGVVGAEPGVRDKTHAFFQKRRHQHGSRGTRDTTRGPARQSAAGLCRARHVRQVVCSASAACSLQTTADNCWRTVLAVVVWARRCNHVNLGPCSARRESVMSLPDDALLYRPRPPRRRYARVSQPVAASAARLGNRPQPLQSAVSRPHISLPAAGAARPLFKPLRQSLCSRLRVACAELASASAGNSSRLDSRHRPLLARVTSPAIGASTTWQLDRDGANCARSYPRSVVLGAYRAVPDTPHVASDMRPDWLSRRRTSNITSKASHSHLKQWPGNTR